MRLPGASSTLLPLAVMAMLAGFTFWLDHANRGETQGPNPKLRHDPDFWADDFIIRRFNPDGTIQHTLKATRMQHYPDDDTTLVSEPRIAYFRAGRTATLTAESAWLDKDGEHVQLRDDVRVVQMDAQGNTTTIETQKLNIAPDEERADTNAPVTITQGRSSMYGEGGMETNNKSRITVLKGPVSGTIYREDAR